MESSRGSSKRLLESDKEKGYELEDQIISIICYADDAVILAENEDDLQRLLNRLHTASLKYNMDIATSKTKSRARLNDANNSLGRLSRSASELSGGGAGSAGAGACCAGPPRARSAQPRRPPSVINRTQGFFHTLKSRWHRSRSKERVLGGARDGSAGSSTEYAADLSSDHSSSATPSTQSPRHRATNIQDSPLARAGPEPVERPPTPLPTPAALDLIPVMDDEIIQKKEAQLRQFSFFQLRIHLKRGQNLVAMDKNGTSDPYVKFKTGGRLLHKSKTIYRDLNPVWDETFTVPIEDPFQPIHIKVFDYDWGLQDDFMGSCYLDLTALELGRPQDLLLCLQDPNKSAVTQDMGEVILNATLWPRTQEDKEQPRLTHIQAAAPARSGSEDPAIRMAENEDSKMQRVKNRLTKMHDKLQSKVEDIYEDLQETVHLASPKVNKFVSHLSQPKGDKLKKSESVETINQRSSSSQEDTVERSSSLENLQVPPMEDEPVQKLRLSSKIKILKQMLKRSMNTIDDDADSGLKLSKSEISLLRKELFSNDDDTTSHIKMHATNVEYSAHRQRKESRESEAFESDESFKDPPSDEDKHLAVEDDGAISDTSATSKKSEARSEKEHSTIEKVHTELVPTSGGHLPLPCEILEMLGNRFPKIKEKSDMVHRYFQRNTRLCDVNKRLKCQIWSSVVTIVLVEAKGLTPMDQDTGSSDPYCKFRLGNEKYKSKVVWRSLNPCWLEQFDLHLYDDQEQLLEITMWDRDKQSKDDFLGRCVIDLSMLEREKTHSIRENLEDSNGQVFLLLTISGTTSSETITDLTNYQDNPRERKNIEDKYAWHRLDIWNETGSGGVGWLCVKVFGAKGLAAADLGGKSDPFCVLELVNSRLQTHTEYKTLQPNWMKIFTFNVKDITSVLEITVYDEDHDHKVEFLGKLAIPLLNIKNGDKRWYSLKDKKMRARAKGSCPQILLEMTVIWNPIKACVRALNPREDKYMHTEIKFKRQVFLRNVIRLKSIIMWFIEIGKILQACFEWESRIRSFVALLGWIVACYYFEPWMAPFGLLLLFGRNWLFVWLTGGSSYLQQPIDDEELLAEEDDDDPEQDKEEKKSLKERLQAIQEVTQSVQNSIGFMASLGEEVKNLFNFTVPYLSWLAILLLLAASFVLFLIPVRFLLMLWGINKFARKILRPHTIPNNEVLDLLSRVPDDEELLDFRELKTHTNNEPRRDARKKHKVT